ncbi:MAG: hypothetical protein DPW16_06805 [Chloroflexi bacterium]|nr:hypothetical protein [Chloroflexota bacterium]
MTNKQIIEKLLESLEEVRQRPRLFFGEDVPPVLHFLWGFKLACEAAEIDKSYQDMYIKIQMERNWQINNALHPVVLMARQGLAKDAIIQEALTLELETWKRLLAELSNNE